MFEKELLQNFSLIKFEFLVFPFPEEIFEYKEENKSRSVI